MTEKGKKPIYVEFIGLPGSGKTTICRALAKELKKNDIEVAIREEEFVKYGKIYRHTVPIVHAVRRLGINFFKYLFFAELGQEINASLKSKFNSWKVSVKQIASTCLMLNKNKGEVAFSDEGVLCRIMSLKPSIAERHKLESFFNKYVEKDSVFVFVKISPTDSFNRLKTRESDVKNRDKKSLLSVLDKGNHSFIDYYKKVDKAFSKTFNFLIIKEEEKIIKSAIMINGAESVEKNVSFLKEIILKKRRMVN